jgi:hypothetical protein
VLLGNGDGTFATPIVVSTAPAMLPITGDFNGDGIPDIAGVIFNGAVVFLGNPDGSFQAPSMARTLMFGGSSLLTSIVTVKRIWHYWDRTRFRCSSIRLVVDARAGAAGWVGRHQVRVGICWGIRLIRTGGVLVIESMATSPIPGAKYIFHARFPPQVDRSPVWLRINRVVICSQ